MKKCTYIFMLLSVITTILKAQEKSSFGFYTDRDVYVSGETLLAKIFTPENNSTTMVYMDLVGPFGKRISGASLEISNNQADGYLQLPDSLSSGTYQLRAYQKNTNGKHKVIREIWISNRFDGLEKTGQIKRAVVSEIMSDQKETQISISEVQPEYPVRSQIAASIQIGEQLIKEIDGNLLVCVSQSDRNFASANFQVESEQLKEATGQDKGIVLSGIVTDKKTLLPADSITVYLTIPDSIPGFQYYVTRKDGKFYFQIDKYHGSVQAVIQCFGKTAAQRLKIKLDEQYDGSGVHANFKKLPVPEEFKDNIKRNIDAVTLQKIFAQDKIKFSVTRFKKPDLYPYYGKPSQVVDPQQFIDLPNFNEISKELLPGVKFRNFNNEPSLQVFNATNHMYFDEKPLILIDGIPVRDLNVIKGMGTADIDRIEVCQSERFYGDLRFAGVVAIYTTKADYTNLPESDQLIRLKLETIQTPATLIEPQITEPNIPDLRQVIYWNPSVEPQEKLMVKCTASSVMGQYRLVVRGRLKDGTLFFSDKPFEVK